MNCHFISSIIIIFVPPESQDNGGLKLRLLLINYTDHAAQKLLPVFLLQIFLKPTILYRISEFLVYSNIA